ncbi:gliding motility-associated C-terminal domain-containing protein [Paracrocinitomix mangrovi]|uniref:T9SS type B sorting domain-containing protein n=1 Tax=Paracrocinitomix mangrovi TaxID=2862509 RepID=UPI001C8EC725|nr:gliding motility-associated C-terminal domain-containing protein [Paracrocinitomix mangrovi]UKN02503.1 gliding motility-associated C-terminal domain-containing protein [Paracrocinitomix mangrovi]
MNNLKKFLFSTLLVGASVSSIAQGNVACVDMEPICTDAGLNFTANAGGGNVLTTQPGNNYGCLGYSPNPTWYYLEISQSGAINMNLWAPQDIDFIIWGPFTDLATAQGQCGNLGNGGAGQSVIDCSYSSTNNEFPDIPNAVVGEVYVMLITNYANSVQDLTLTQVGGTGATDCSIVQPDPCVSDPGTFVIQEDPVGAPPLVLATSPLYLCEGDAFLITSNGDYILPNDTIAQPVGDGIYSAQLMWLVYDGVPTSGDPSADPNFLNFIIPMEDLSDVNDAASPIIQNFGCGTYYFVPVAGDDGIGGNNNAANGVNDNGGLDWDKNNNGCYLLGDAIEVTYACAITTTSSVNCNPPSLINGIDIDITGGAGNYTVVNLGAGNLASTSVTNGGTATVANLGNNDNWSIQLTDTEGCLATASGVFSAPVITNITLTPAPDCPVSGTGQVDVTVNGTSGQGAPYTIVMASDPPIVGTTGNYVDVAGTIVPIVVSDQDGCISDSTVTIPSAGHFINVQIQSVQGEFCYGDGDGAASISATAVPAGSSTITSIEWTDPNGQVSGNTAASHTTESGMLPGVWTVCVTDDLGCEVCIPIEITAPQELDIFVENSNEPVCYGFSDGSIDVGVSGGTQPLSFSWSHNTSLTGDVANTIPAGTYWAYVTDDNGCMDSIEVIMGQPDSLHGYFTIKDVLCYGDSTGGIIVDSVAGNFGNVTYNWNMQGQVPNPPNNFNTAGNLPAGTYVITLLDDNGCNNEYEFTLTQNPPITLAEFGSEPAYCRLFNYQSGNGVVYVSATGGVADYTYLWTNLGTGQTSSNTTWGGLNPGQYSIVVTDDVGCTLYQTIQLDSVNPIADFTVISSQLDGNLEGTAPVEVQFENQSLYFANPNNPNSDTTFFWNLNHNNVPWYITHDYFEVMDTIYTGENVFEVCLVAINKNGCTDTSCVDIIVHEQPDILPPNVFTPGGDGDNDVFTFFLNSQGVDEFSAVIVDRWGKTMFEFNSITDAWNGDNKNGKPCTEGVYFYTYEIVYTNGTTGAGQGTVTLIRQ